MTEALYQQAIKDLAAAAHGAGRLAAADAQAVRDNPLCGDRIALEIGVTAGRVGELAHRTTGCLLCRAAASALADAAIGLDVAGAAELADGVAAMLGQGGEPPLPVLAAFRPVAAHRRRHDCVMLPFRALVQALGG